MTEQSGLVFAEQKGPEAEKPPEEAAAAVMVGPTPPPNALPATRAPAEGERACDFCRDPFVPRRPHQRFCSTACRQGFHAQGDHGLRGAVVSNRILRRGKVSMVIQFGIEDREAALAIVPGDVVEVVK